MISPWQYADRTHTEHAEQVALFIWARMAERYGAATANKPDAYESPAHAEAIRNSFASGPWVRPLVELKWLHAIANHGAGFGRAAEGVKAGVSDVFLPYPLTEVPQRIAGGLQDIDTGWYQYCGLYIELKRLASKRGKAGEASDAQLQFQSDIREEGYACEVAVGWEEARDVILRYLGLLT